MTNMDDDVNKSLKRINTQYGEALARLAEDEKKERWQKFLKAMQELGEIMEDESKLFDTEAESWWNNLPYEDKLKAFHSVCKRIHQGDIQDKGSYRHVLYEVFGFGPDSYIIGMNCGYLDIHNSIYTDSDKTKDTQ